MGDSPFIDKDGEAGSDANEFSLRPLRIQKRAEKSSGPDRTSKSEAPGLFSTRLAGSDEFVCRPMRLGLLTTPSKAREAQRESKTQNEGLTLEPIELPGSSRHSAAATPTKTHSRLTSIQVKNLPIVQSPKRAPGAEALAINDIIFAVCLVDFHHARGPEVQWWRSNYHQELDPDHTNKLFKNLPFQALPDGLHLFEETFSNFNLVYDFESQLSLDDLGDIEQFKGNPNRLETLFGCSCVRQVKTDDLLEAELERNKDITRSIVQKAVVVISRKQPIFTKIKEKLSIITHSFFQQETFGNLELLESLFDNLNDAFRLKSEAEEAAVKQEFKSVQSQLEPDNHEEHEEYFVNLNLRQLVLQLKSDILVVWKALLLEKRVLVYSNNNLELLTQFQNNMIALIPNLINNLELSGCPLCDYTEKYSPLQKPASLKTNDRLSMLRFFGLPLQVFNTKGLFWNPYLPLQQMDELKTPSFMVGCSNLLIVNQLAQYQVDVLVNLDSWTVSYPCGKPEELKLSTLDKKFVQILLAANTSKEAYIGSDDYIRYHFEDYMRSLLATTRFQQYVDRFKVPPPGFDTQQDKLLGSLRAFNVEFVAKWQQTKNHLIWNATCDEFIFNFHLPAHIATGMSEQGGGYYFGGLFSSFRKAPQQHPSTLVDRANQYYSHAQQPRKFIASEEKGESEEKMGYDTDTEALGEGVTEAGNGVLAMVLTGTGTGAGTETETETYKDETTKEHGAKSAWTWRFKKTKPAGD